MRFGPVPVAEAEGAILAHSLNHDGVRMKKGRTLGASDVAALTAAGVTEVTVARLGPDDVGEDAAAEAIAASLVKGREPLSVSAPFTGRVNLFATAAGVLRVDRTAVDGLNALDPAITLATLPTYARVVPRQMVATVKVIPYAAPGESVRLAVRRLVQSAGVLRLSPFRPHRVSLILTRTPGMKESLLAKGARSVAARLSALGQEMGEPVTVAHETGAVAEAVSAADGDLVMILGASATSDSADVCPAGMVAAGGELVRFGLPVDPGNLLFLGRQAGRPVLGLPGCARSPALNGADWVLERLAAEIEVTSADLAAMGVGGLLKEIPARPQPRAGRQAPTGRPKVAAIVLAAGAARRMRGADKLLEEVEGMPVLARATEVALSSQADETVVVLPPGAEHRREAIAGLAVEVVEAADWEEGMAASLRAGLRAVAARADAVVVLLADMPEVTARAVDRLIAAFDPEEGREICRAVSADGKPGHPVLFGRRFFETLGGLTGDRGAREVIRDAAEFVTEVATEGQGAVVDLDTPEDWAAWRAARAG